MQQAFTGQNCCFFLYQIAHPFFQKIVEERQRSEDVQEELDRLKDERKEAERELEELKQIMDEQF